jgi:hypothetical protein
MNATHDTALARALLTFIVMARGSHDGFRHGFLFIVHLKWSVAAKVGHTNSARECCANLVRLQALKQGQLPGSSSSPGVGKVCSSTLHTPVARSQQRTVASLLPLHTSSPICSARHKTLQPRSEMKMKRVCMFCSIKIGKIYLRPVHQEYMLRKKLQATCKFAHQLVCPSSVLEPFGSSSITSDLSPPFNFSTGTGKVLLGNLHDALSMLRGLLSGTSIILLEAWRHWKKMLECNSMVALNKLCRLPGLILPKPGACFQDPRYTALNNM